MNTATGSRSTPATVTRRATSPSRINIGMIGINVPIPVPLAYHSFGGWKASSFGDLNQHGSDSIRFWTRTKTVTSRWPSGIKDGAEFVMPHDEVTLRASEALSIPPAPAGGIFVFGLVFAIRACLGGMGEVEQKENDDRRKICRRPIRSTISNSPRPTG